jgi:tripartite ATP-independent transporter DctM subunit
VNLFQSFWGSSASWTLAALPLFIWMGEILYRTKLSEEMFEGLAPWLGWLPGRLMHVNILGCAIFGTVSGSSAATCATIAKVALPELKRRGYDEKTCLGSLAAAGTLGILLPPSIIMVVYAVAAEVSIIKVFLAGFIPVRAHRAVLRLHHRLGAAQSLENAARRGQDHLRAEALQDAAAHSLHGPHRLRGLGNGDRLGHRHRGAAYGVLGALGIAWWSGGLNRQTFWQSLMGATRLSCMIMFILAGASFLSSCMAFTGIPRALAEWVHSLAPHKYTLIAILAVIYILLGTALDGVSMIVLTTSIVIPMVEKAGLRSRLVRHLHRAAGRDRRAHAAAGLQHLRAADHDRP